MCTCITHGKHTRQVRAQERSGQFKYREVQMHVDKELERTAPEFTALLAVCVFRVLRSAFCVRACVRG
jgi:hypothetical protein